MFDNLTEEQKRIVEAILASLEDKKPAPREWTVEEILAREG